MASLLGKDTSENSSNYLYGFAAVRLGGLAAWRLGGLAAWRLGGLAALKFWRRVMIETQARGLGIDLSAPSGSSSAGGDHSQADLRTSPFQAPNHKQMSTYAKDRIQATVPYDRSLPHLDSVQPGATATISAKQDFAAKPVTRPSARRSALFSWKNFQRVGVILLLTGQRAATAHPFSLTNLCDEKSPAECIPAMHELARRDVNGQFAAKYNTFRALLPVMPVRAGARSIFTAEDGPTWNLTHKMLFRGKIGTKVYAPVDTLAHEILHQRDYVLTPITTMIAAKMYHPLLSTMAEVRAEHYSEEYFQKSQHKPFANPRVSDGFSEKTYAVAQNIFDDSLDNVDPAKRHVGMAFSYDGTDVEQNFPYSRLVPLPNAFDLHKTFWKLKTDANDLRQKLLKFPAWKSAVDAGYLDCIAAFDKRAFAYLLTIEKLERKPNLLNNDHDEL